jgi:hypothetical protein
MSLWLYRVSAATAHAINCLCRVSPAFYRHTKACPEFKREEAAKKPKKRAKEKAGSGTKTVSSTKSLSKSAGLEDAGDNGPAAKDSSEHSSSEDSDKSVCTTAHSTHQSCHSHYCFQPVTDCVVHIRRRRRNFEKQSSHRRTGSLRLN